jgi:hypothetical protein
MRFEHLHRLYNHLKPIYGIIQQASTSTVYITLSSSSAVEIGKAPTGTTTRFKTIYSTTTPSVQIETVYITSSNSS